MGQSAAASRPAGVSPEDMGRAYAEEWARKATEEDLGKLLSQRPRIPIELDLGLIVDAEKVLGSLRGRDTEKRALRRGFWQAFANPGSVLV